MRDVLQGVFVGLCLIAAFEVFLLTNKVEAIKVAVDGVRDGRLECSEWMPNTATCVQWRFVSKDSAK